MGATFGEDTTTDNTGYDTSTYGEGFDETTGECGPGYYMAPLDSGEQGCIPEGGNNEDDYIQNPDLTDAELCASKGGIWWNGECDFPGGDQGGDEFDDTLP